MSERALKVFKCRNPSKLDPMAALQSFTVCCGSSFASLERMAAIASDLGVAGPALVSISLDGVEDVELSAARPGGRRVRQPEVILPVAKLAEMNGELAPKVQEQLDILWQTAGWIDGSPSFTSEAWAGYSDKQNYSIE
ncbi:hypothetical protein [Bradyrhizobium sp. SZCCHNRI20481]|nr:hypothetical protein [Bradyrhizobium sp. SZCCHNRI20481]